MKIEQIAKLAYEVNRAICEADLDDLKSQVPWDVADAEVKANVRDGVIQQFNSPKVISKGLAEFPFAQRLKDYVFIAIVNTCKTFPVVDVPDVPVVAE